MKVHRPAGGTNINLMTFRDSVVRKGGKETRSHGGDESYEMFGGNK